MPERNIPKRMRFYQAAIDISFLDKGNSYNKLNDSFIIFICLFDVIGKKRPVYTFEHFCREDKNITLQDGTKKIIINAEAFNQTENQDLKDFLEYLKNGTANSDFTRRIHTMIETIKTNEQVRQEYRLMSTFEMDARDKGFSEGAYQKAIETAKNLLEMGFSSDSIVKATGLSLKEVETL